MSRNKARVKGTANTSGKNRGKKKSPKRSRRKPTTKKLIILELTTRKPTTGSPARTAEEPVKKNETTDAKKPVDMVQARENVSQLVRESAAAIATGVIDVAKGGQLASAKYLFEAIGLYPATGQTPERPAEDSLAHILLRRMGLPLEPVVTDDDDEPMVLARGSRGIDDESDEPAVEREGARAGCEKEQPAVEDENQDEENQGEDKKQAGRHIHKVGEDAVE